MYKKLIFLILPFFLFACGLKNPEPIDYSRLSEKTGRLVLDSDNNGAQDVPKGGTNASTLTDGGVLLGSGTNAVTAMPVLADGEVIVGDGTTDPVAESGATLRTSIGVGTEDTPQFTGVHIGSTDTTLTEPEAGEVDIEGKQIYHEGDENTIAAAMTDNQIDSIGEGDSEVDVVDSGSGYIEHVADGEQQEKISDGYHEVINGLAFRTITTTDGHTMIFQAYDTNGATWRNVLTIENGDSSQSDASDWPRVVLGSNTAFSGLGSAGFGYIWGSDISSSPTSLTYTAGNRWYSVTIAATVNLPDVGTASDDSQYGDWVMLVPRDAGEIVTVDVTDASDKINFNGTAQGAGASITSNSAPGSLLFCVATTDADGSGTDGWKIFELSTRSISNPVIGDPDSWTPSTSDYYSGRFIANANGTSFALPALASGMGFSLSVDDSITVTVDRNGSDTFTMTYLVDGTPTQGSALTSLDLAGPELCVFGYRSSGVWEVQCGDNTVDGS